MQSDIAWCLAKFEMDHHFFDLAAVRAASLAENFTPNICSKLIWSFACVQRKIPDFLLTSILLKVSTSLKQCPPESLTNIVWGLAALQQDQFMGGEIISYMHLEVFERLGNARAAKQFSPQNLSNYFWAFGLCPKDTVSGFRRNQQKLTTIEYCNRFEGIFIRRIHEFTSQEIANICMTCARLDYFSVTMMDKIADTVLSSIQAFDGQNLSSIVWSFAMLRYAHKKLFASLSLVIESKLGTFSCKDIGNILWAYTVLNLEADRFVPHLVEEILRRIHMREGDIDPSLVSNIVWALSISNAIDSSVWNALIQIIDFDSLTDDREKVCRQIFESYLISNARNREYLSLEIPGNAKALCEEAWKACMKKFQISDLHTEVSQILDLMSEEHVVGYLSEDEIFCIDIAFPSEKIAMQLEIPRHFTRENDPLGDILARYDLLRAHGWQLISIPFFSWAKDTKAQKELLENTLTNARESRWNDTSHRKV